MLYRVRIEADVIVSAESEDEALARAEDRLWFDDDMLDLMAMGAYLVDEWGDRIVEMEEEKE